MDFAALEKGKTMAKEYIEREATIELLRSIGSRDYRREKGTIQEAIKMVSFSEYTPAADVAPVRHERWEKHGSKWQCTGCKVLMSIDGTPQENLLYYCPNCGASMDKEVADETCIYQPCAE